MIRLIKRFFTYLEARREKKRLVKELDAILYDAFMASTKVRLGIDHPQRRKND